MRILLLVFLPLFLNGQMKLTKKEWQEDLNFLQEKLEKRHANLYHSISKLEFHNKLEEIKNLAGEIEDKELIVRISELIARVKDAHTWLHIGYQENWNFKLLPLQLKYFDDGLFIIGADREYKHLIGSQILNFNGHDIKEVISKVKQVGYNENDFTQLISIERFMVYYQVLKRFGFAEDPEKILVRLKQDKSKEQVYEISPVLRNEINWIKFEELQTDLPLIYKDNDKKFWTSYSSGEQLFYIQMNSCTENDSLKFDDLQQTIIAETRKSKLQKLVIDLRRNVGGNSRLTYPLIYALMDYENQVENGQIFIITGRWTLSASIVFIDEIKKFCNPIIIGEPTGAGPNLFGENSYNLKLPHSGLSVSYSSEWFQAAGPFVNAPWIAPDIYTPIKSWDYFNLRQPILNEIIDYKRPKNTIVEQLRDLALQDKIEEAVQLYHNYKKEPKNKFVDIKNEIRRMANRLGDRGKEDYALIFHQMNAKDNPNSLLVMVNLAQFYEGLGRTEEAGNTYSKTKSLLNKDLEINEYLRHYIEDFVEEKLLPGNRN